MLSSSVARWHHLCTSSGHSRTVQLSIGSWTTFMECWNELLRRTTSPQSDLLIIFAIMLDLSVYEVELFKPLGLRLLAILSTQELLPMSFLFNGMRLDNRVNKHCSWLPESMIMSVDNDCGQLREMKDSKTNQYYHRLIVRQGRAYVIRVQRTASRSRKLRLRVQSSVLPPLVLKIATMTVEDRR